MHLSPGSACFVFGFGNRHFKFPVTPGARQGLLREFQGEACAAQDAFWSPYLWPARYHGGFLKHAGLCDDKADELVFDKLLLALTERLGKLQPVSRNWKAPFPRIASITNPVASLQDRLDDIFQDEKCASIHGDLCAANCLNHEGRPVLIDWGNFRTDFWAPYDLLHPEVVQQSNRTGSPWFACLQDRLGTGGWEGMQAVRYVICRCELEADQDIAMGRLDRLRFEKYRAALSWADEVSKT